MNIIANPGVAPFASCLLFRRIAESRGKTILGPTTEWLITLAKLDFGVILAKYAAVSPAAPENHFRPMVREWLHIFPKLSSQDSAR
jgi:hypothetical protein